MSILIFLMLVAVLLNGMNIFFMTLSVLLISIMISFMIYGITLTSWLSMILILTFSTGMMTLFMYMTSMVKSQVKQKFSAKVWMVVFLTLVFESNVFYVKEMTVQMKKFTSSFTLILLTVVLLMTMVGVSFHGMHPNQAMSQSF